MSSIGTGNLAVVVTAASRLLAFNVRPWQRAAVAVTITGHNVAAASLALLIYRGSTNTLVAQCQAFTGSTATATGTLDLNTEEMEDAFPNVARGVERDFKAVLWNEATGNLIGEGELRIRSFGPVYTEETGATSLPALKGYVQNETDGLWYPVVAVGAGDEMHFEIDTAGGTANP